LKTIRFLAEVKEVESIKLETLESSVQKQKEEIIGIFLNSLQLMRESISATYGFLQLVKDAMDVIISTHLHQNSFTLFYCLMSYYKQYVNCLFGNERLTRQRLLKRRGFGLFLEHFDENNNLNTLGLFHAKEFIISVKEYVMGRNKKEIFGLIAMFLYYSEVKSTDNALMMIEPVEFFSSHAEVYLKCLEDPELAGAEGEAVTFHHFLQFFHRKHCRHFLKSYAANIIDELCLKNEKIENDMASQNISLCVQYRQKIYCFYSGSLICSISNLKKALERHDFYSLKAIWHTKVGKGFEVDGSDEILVETLRQLIGRANLSSIKFGRVDILNVLLDPDTIAR
jgi:hypothetical protein